MEAILGVWHSHGRSLDVLILAHITARSIGPTGVYRSLYTSFVIIWQTLLVIMALVSFFVDVAAIIKGKRRESLTALVTLVLVGIALAFTLVQNAHVSAENRALTDVQARAQNLVSQWRNINSGTEFDPAHNSRGANEGITATAMGLLEEVKDCRPLEAEAARQRLANARSKTDRLGRGSFDTFDVWNDAADAAYTEIAAIAEVSPRCAPRGN
ncbi:MAG: hypothetical protein LC776_15660 [Acidobacteria bacterium]|nr:hypothetical protein [Acidobacteriota bacterium]